MKSQLKILMVFPEVAPFATTGLVGEVGCALPKALKDMGHDVRVITPQYRSVNERKYILRDVIRLQNISVPLGDEVVQINVKSAFLPDSKVQVYFIDYKPFFFRDGLYCDAKKSKAYPDNDKRFILFSKGVIETLLKLQWQPDVIHCYDWPSGMLPFLMRYVYHDNVFFNKTHSLFSTYQLDHLGLFNADCYHWTSINENFQFKDSGLDYQGQCSFLKAGIVYSEVVSTSGDLWSNHNNSADQGIQHIHTIYKKPKKSISHVVNGVDYKGWDPLTDACISENYDIHSLSKKEENKRILLEKVNLPYSKRRPVVGFAFQSKNENSLRLLKEEIEPIMALDVTVVIVADSDKGLRTFFKELQNRYVDRLSVVLLEDVSLLHLLEAGSDLRLIPNTANADSHESIYCLKYGTVPILMRSQDGRGPVTPFDIKTGKGMGFFYDAFVSGDLVACLQKAVDTFADRKTWLKIMKNGMREDFSWHEAAKKYVQLYQRCMMAK